MLAETLDFEAGDYDTAFQRFSPVEDLFDELRNGRMVIIYDDGTDRGFLLGAAQMATPGMINGMAREGKGVICLALTRQRIEELGLPMMAGAPDVPHDHAFTVSIEARNGVSTGISAADRAKTIATAIYTTDPAKEIVTPGHIFPLRAADGGLLERIGQVEAATDLARLAGMNPSGVICSIINDAGEDADLGDLAQLARRLDIQIGSIQDIVVFRQKQDRFMTCTTAMTFESRHGGQWWLKIFTSALDKSKTIVLQIGGIDHRGAVPLELRAFSPLVSLIAEAGGNNDLAHTMDAISAHGAGIIIFSQEAGDPTSVQRLVGNPLLTHEAGKIAQILTDLDVESVTLLSHCDLMTARLKAVGVSVVA